MEFLELLGVYTVSDLLFVIFIVCALVFIAGVIFGQRQVDDDKDYKPPMPPTQVRRK